MSKTNSILLFIMAVVIVALIAAIVVLALTPSPSDKFTEFYILSSDGKASGYPQQTAPGSPMTIRVGVVNREGTAASYRVQVVADNAIITSIVTGELSNGQKWESPVTFSLTSPGNGQRVQFFLYMNGEDKPHINDPLVLAIDVISPK
jgi:uncharacterized membrane protein